MERKTLNAMRFSASRWASRLSWPWIASVGLLVFIGGIFISVVEPAQHELDTLHQNLLSLQRQVNSSAKKPAMPASSTSPTQLAVFYHFFPDEQSLPDWLEKILNAANENELVLTEGDYRITRDKIGKLQRYQIRLPLNGSYLNIRKFLSTVLSELPASSLDNVKFERQKIGDSGVEATIELTLYFGQTS
jgi:Tfp pilus assembly protein PilO